jgi:hypothetical protein
MLPRDIVSFHLEALGFSYINEKQEREMEY